MQTTRIRARIRSIFPPQSAGMFRLTLLSLKGNYERRKFRHHRQAVPRCCLRTLHSSNPIPRSSISHSHNSYSPINRSSISRSNGEAWDSMGGGMGYLGGLEGGMGGMGMDPSMMGMSQPTLPQIQTSPQPLSSFILATPLSSTAEPELNFTTEWEIFKKARTGRGKDCKVIDVLDGEPVLSFDMNALESIWWSGWTKRLGKEDDKARKRETPDVLRQPELTPGKAPLPERIRIHSKHIITILTEIHGKAINDNAVVMVRPFRALAYYEKHLRQKYEALSTKYKGREVSFVKLNLGPNDEGTESFESFRYLKCLIEFIDMTIQAKAQYLSSSHCHRVAFADIWYLFKPGDEVIGQDRRQAYRVLSITSSGHKFIPPWKTWQSRRAPSLSESSVTLHCVHVDFDGQKLGPVSTKINIFRFDGEKDVTSLPVFPLRFAKDPNAGEIPKQTFRERLIARGEMFVDVVGMMPMHYNGPTLDPRDEVDSQVVIDFEEAFSSKENEYKPPVLEQLIGTPIGESKEEEPCSAACCAGEEVHQDAYAETKRNQDYISTLNRGPEHQPSVAIDTRDLEDTKSQENRLSDEEFVIMSYRVYGFVLRSRKWAKLDLTYLSPIGSKIEDGGENVDTQEGESVQESDDVQESEDDEMIPQVSKAKKRDTAFDQLVLPEGHKKIVLSLIAQHFQEKRSRKIENEETDIVRGKGKGLIILLHGAPGVGKTTTAEGVAQVFNKPLFQITCGDLGDDASKVETALERHFFLANRWGCVLLLDEADVFLAERSPQDFVRNSLVAVFLRVLEYYAGILFLTTNRIGDFDEAFASRIHVSLYYPPLKRKPTKKIFQLNLRLIRQRIEDRGLEIDIDEDGILRFASKYWKKHKKMRWNGRQIRNACQTALALAEFDAQRGVLGEVTDAVAEVSGKVDELAKVDLRVHYLEIVAKAYLEFMNYLNAIYGRDSERRAKYLGIRAREFVVVKEKANERNNADEMEEDEETSDEEDSGNEEEPGGEEIPQELPSHGAAVPFHEAGADGTTDNSTPASPPFHDPRMPQVPTYQAPNLPFPLASLLGGGGGGASAYNNPLLQSLLYGQQQQLPGPYAQEAQRQQLLSALLGGGGHQAAVPGLQPPAPGPGAAGPAGGPRRQDQSRGRR
ncbi:hypothetical protein N431DRAFT_438325 [Stipitochalara longipes BDJ]|nr:hypothetical protein N431DRAFT_438325 [Stipitochalara longipes BDJ]